jgi:hypothetical protein
MLSTSAEVTAARHRTLSTSNVSMFRLSSGCQEVSWLLSYRVLPHRMKVYVDIQTDDDLMGRDELERLLSQVSKTV